MNRLEYLLDALREDPTDSFLAFAIAKEFEGMGQEEKALEYYLNLRQSNPAYLGLYYHLGKLLEEKGELTQALEAYESGIKVAKSQSDFHALAELNNAKVNLEIEM